MVHRLKQFHQVQKPLVLDLLGLDGISPPVPLLLESVALSLPIDFPPFQRLFESDDVLCLLLYLGLKLTVLPFQLCEAAVLLLDDVGVRAQLLRLLGRETLKQ